MATAKDIYVAPISSADAAALVRRVHYSGKVVQNSQLHFGVFLDGRLEGAGMYRGEKVTRGKEQASECHSDLGGAIPTSTLHKKVGAGGTA